MSILPKTRGTDYSFLANKESGQFYTRKPQYNLDINPKTLQDCSGTFLKFRENHKNSKLLDDDRINSLEQCFEDAIGQMTSFQGLMSEIKNEYSLIINGIKNKMDEKLFLTTKIQQMLSHLATPDQVEEQKNIFKCLQDRFEVVRLVSERLKSMMRDYELQFIHGICTQFDHQLETATTEKNVKLRKDFLQLGKWNYVKDWLESHSINNQEIQELRDLVLQQPFRFKAAIPEDEELICNEFDSMELRKLKTHIEDQKKSVKIHEKDIELLSKKKKSLEDQLQEMDRKMKDVRELIKSKASTSSDRRLGTRDSFIQRKETFYSHRKIFGNNKEH